MSGTIIKDINKKRISFYENKGSYKTLNEWESYLENEELLQEWKKLTSVLKNKIETVEKEIDECMEKANKLSLEYRDFIFEGDDENAQILFDEIEKLIKRNEYLMDKRYVFEQIDSFVGGMKNKRRR